MHISTAEKNKGIIRIKLIKGFKDTTTRCKSGIDIYKHEGSL